jgi:hypothetical protein
MRRPPARLVRPLAALGVAAALTVALTQSTTSAVFTAQTGDSGNQVSSAATFCASPGHVDTFTAAVDTGLYESQPGSNFSTNASTGVISTAPGRARTLIKFDLSGRPARCTAQSAVLTMRVNSGTAGATVEVCRAAAAWNPTTVNWGSDPGFTGPCAPATSVTNGNPIQWNVATQVTGLVTIADHGFEIKFATESGTTYTQLFDSMDATTTLNRPRLVVTWN